MAIVSISLNNDILQQLDELQKEMGFSGRSEALRAGLRLLIAENRERAKLSGLVDAILIAVHHDEDSRDISELRHKHQSVIRTQIHQELQNGKCLEVFVLKGDAQKVRKATADFKKTKKIENAKLILA